MKDVRDFKSDTLAAKKKRLINAVKKASESLGVPFPIAVNITEEPCPHYSGNEKAHIHIEEGAICVWERNLVKMNFDEIREVAAHEVAHLKSARHDAEHTDTTTEIQIKTWKPPGGVIWVRPGKRGVELEGKDISLPERLEEFTVKELQQLARDKDLSGYSNLRKSELIEMINGSVESDELKAKLSEWACSYHLCEKVGTNLSECEYCGETFCQEHKKARLPSPPPFKDPTVDREEWTGAGHPCPKYPEHIKKEGEKKFQKIKKGMDELLKPKPKNLPKESEVKERSETKTDEILKDKILPVQPEVVEKSETKTENKYSLLKFALEATFIIGILILLLYYFDVFTI